MVTQPEHSQSPASRPVDTSGSQFSADPQGGNRSETVTTRGRLTQEEAQVSNVARVQTRLVSEMTRMNKRTPSPDAHLARQLSTASFPFSMLNLDTQSPLASELAEISVSTEKQNIRESGSASTGLERAYSTILKTANIPIGHQSSRTLRRVVLSRTTSQVESIVETRDNTNSSPVSFVQIFNLELDQPDDENLMHDSSQSLNQRLSMFRECSHRLPCVELPLPDPIMVLQDRRATSEPPRLSEQHLPMRLGTGSDSSWFNHNPRMRTVQFSEGASPQELCDSAENLNKLDFWWKAGIRDGDPVATPPLMMDSSPSLSSKSRAQQTERSGLATLHESLTRESRSSRISDPHLFHCSDISEAQFGRSEMAWQPAPGNISHDSIELGREIASSISAKTALSRGSCAKGPSLRIAEDDDRYALLSPADSGERLLEPAELLQETQSQLTFREWDTNILLAESSGLEKRLTSRSRRSNASSSSPQNSMCGPGGILAPEKRGDSESFSREVPLAVDPSALRISENVQPWDPIVNGSYVTFKFVLLIVANRLRCYPEELPSHPIVHYLAKASLVPEDSFRTLISRELATGSVIGRHISRHDLFFWYRQVFRASTSSAVMSGSFQAIISSLIQLGLGLPLEPLVNSLPSPQSNSPILCLLAPGACRDHRELDRDQFEQRPQTPQGPRSREVRGRSIDVQVLSPAWNDVEQFSYNIKDDLELSSSSSEDGTPLQHLQFCGASVSNPFLDDSPAQEKRLHGFGLKLLDALEDKRKEANDTLKSDNVVRNKGKAKMLNEDVWESRLEASQIDSQARFASTLPRLSALKACEHNVSSGEFTITGLKFTNSKWNVFNRVLGLVSHTLQIPYQSMLEDARIVYQLVHEARTSVPTFHQWWFNAAGEEAEEEKAVMLRAEGPFWTATSDGDGRWSGQSIVSAMFAILPAQRGACRVAHFAPFQRALLHLIKICDASLVYRPIDETLGFLRSFEDFLNYEPWSAGMAARQAIQDLKTHLQSPYGSYLAPEARDELQEFVRVQEYQIGPSAKTWEGQEALNALQTAQIMMNP